MPQRDSRFYFGGVSRGLDCIDPLSCFFLYFCTTIIKSIAPLKLLLFLRTKKKFVIEVRITFKQPVVRTS